MTIAPGLLLLAACGGEGPGEDQVLEQAGKLVKPLPGLYRSTTTLTSYELPGAAPQEADTMRERFGRISPQQRTFCITPAEADRGFADFVRQSQDGDCAIERFAADNTRLSASLTCTKGTRLTSSVSVEGTGAPDRSRIALEIVQSGPDIPGGKQTIAMTVDNERIGDCPRGTGG